MEFMEFVRSIHPAWLWFGLSVLFVLIELGTTALVSIWLVVGSLFALITSFITPEPLWQWLVFAVVSILALIVTRPLVRQFRMRSGTVHTGADRNIGRTASVLEAIRPDCPGRVRLDGVDWAARSSVSLEPGALCTVLRVDGTTLTVEALNTTEPVTQPQ